MRTDSRTCLTRIVLLPLAFALLGCGPSINSFRAEPNVICKGSRSHLSWDASTSGTLSAQPPLEGIGAVSKASVAEVFPQEATTFRLDVQSAFGKTSREVSVDVRQAGSDAKPLGAPISDPSAKCDSVTGVSVTANAPANFWDSSLRVGSVGSRDGRAYHVEHGGKVAEIAPGSTTSAFAGQPVSGEWKLVTPLVSGEVCGKSGLPHNLMIDVFATCSP